MNCAYCGHAVPCAACGAAIETPARSEVVISDDGGGRTVPPPETILPRDGRGGTAHVDRAITP